MTRLQHEWQRLYAPWPSAGQAPAPDSTCLVDDAGQVRAMVLALARPADWQALAPVWRGVQADLGWPAPAVAVSGQDGIQLWFSLALPMPATQAAALLGALRRHYLAATPAHRLAMLPAVNPAAAGQIVHAAFVPALQADGHRWSAFVAPDLAAMFADEPWLDLCPNLEGQANLLAALASITPADLAHAMARLQPEGADIGLPPSLAQTPSPVPAPVSNPVLPRADGLAAGGGDVVSSGRAGASLEPRCFLRAVMNDEAVPMALRIEAAKALLPYH